MQRVLHFLLALAGCAAAASHTAEDFARRWLAQHQQAPGMEELSELKSANPEAFAIVQALMTKQSMGLIKRRSHHGDASLPIPEPSPPDMPDMMQPAAPPLPAVVEQGSPSEVMSLSGPPAPKELPEVLPLPPTAPPAMPPPPPISPPLPPALDDPTPMLDIPVPAPAPVPVQAVSEPVVPASEPALPVRLSAAVTRSSVSSGGGHNWLSWHPDQMIADNERMVQNVLGAVAQLTGKGVHHAAKDHQDASDSPLSQDESVVTQQPPQRATVEAPVQPRSAPARRITATLTPKAVTEVAPAASAEDLYLASKDSLPASPRVAEQAHPAEPSDDGIARLPGAVSWSNPYTFTASANADADTSRQENSYLKEVDLGVPMIKLPPKRTSDDDNPYLQGLDLTGSSAHSAPTDISASALTAMHQNQLLSSHTILYEHDLEWTQNKPKQSKRPAVKAVKPKKDALSGFLAPVRQPKAPPASLVNKNAYLAKLGDASKASDSSTLASHIEQGNPYLQALGDAPHLQTVQADEVPTAAAPPGTEVHNIAPKRDAGRPQLSMTSSIHAVHQKASKIVAQKAIEKKQKKDNRHALSGWLRSSATVKAPDVKAQRLQQAVAQKVADAKNPYLKGLDIDSYAAPKAQAQPDQVNPYMASLDQ